MDKTVDEQQQMDLRQEKIVRRFAQARAPRAIQQPIEEEARELAAREHWRELQRQRTLLARSIQAKTPLP
ncbi:hypothetical protein [Anthocerotibacter panamensis]|uniref:hypothetical protein n=1 Tax=Anthocerotibacter panamensis TaxID=2857077 RepID=UPI001C4084DB|nr:hypothetical protein [Anthocerotibacter panamensis]